MQIQNLLRQLDIIPMEKLGEQITIIGAGAIGSFTALSLAKMGFGNLTIWDFDKIETENMNCQFYPMKDVGTHKVEALKAVIYAFSGFTIDTKQARYESEVFPGIVISAVDNMKTRRAIWEAHVAKGSATKAIIDPRMGAEVGAIYVMNPNDEKDRASYEKTLYSDEEAMPERCTEKAVMYSPLIMAGMIGKTVKDLVTGSSYTRNAQLAIKENQFTLWPK